MYRLMPLLPLVLLASSCASVRTSYINKAYPHRGTHCQLQILSLPPREPFEELAVLELDGAPNVGDYVEQIREHACAIGGDAVVVGKIEDRMYGFQFQPPVYHGTGNYYSPGYVAPITNPEGRAIVIRRLTR